MKIKNNIKLTKLNKLCHYRISGLSNKWFESYLANHMQFVSINGFALSTLSITSLIKKYTNINRCLTDIN